MTVAPHSVCARRTSDVEVEVSCVFVWGAGKSFRVEQEIRMTDGTLAAEIPDGPRV